MKAYTNSSRNVSCVNAGFTIIELLVMTFTIAILSAIAIPSFLRLIEKQKVSLISNEVIQKIKETQLKAMSEGENYSATFILSPDALRVAIYPTDSPESIETWEQVGPTIRAKHFFIGTNILEESTNVLKKDTIIFAPLGTTEYAGFRVVIALADKYAMPIPDTLRCILISNDEGQIEIGANEECQVLPIVHKGLGDAASETSSLKIPSEKKVSKEIEQMDIILPANSPEFR